MDMNFPHKHREQIAADGSAAANSTFADHQSLLARAIARQASSPSARDFGAARQGKQAVKKAIRPSFMDERMAFFAGRLGSNVTSRREPTLFRTGCFRPDLVQRDMDKARHG